MFVVSVSIWVRTDCVDDFIEATLDNAHNTRREPENVRFDVLRAADDPFRFQLYEVYKSPEGFTAHQQTEHYARWKSAVTGMMAQPRQSVKLHSIFFGDGNED